MLDRSVNSEYACIRKCAKCFCLKMSFKEVSQDNATGLSSSLEPRPTISSSLWAENGFLIQLCCLLSTGKYSLSCLLSVSTCSLMAPATEVRICLSTLFCKFVKGLVLGLNHSSVPQLALLYCGFLLTADIKHGHCFSFSVEIEVADNVGQYTILEGHFRSLNRPDSSDLWCVISFATWLDTSTALLFLLPVAHVDSVAFLQLTACFQKFLRLG